MSLDVIPRPAPPRLSTQRPHWGQPDAPFVSYIMSGSSAPTGSTINTPRIRSLLPPPPLPPGPEPHPRAPFHLPLAPLFSTQ